MTENPESPVEALINSIHGIGSERLSLVNYIYNQMNPDTQGIEEK